MKKTNFDRYLEEQLRDPAFARRFKRAEEAWDVALQIAALREQAGLSQGTWRSWSRHRSSKISRLESPGYEGTPSVPFDASPKLCMRGFVSYLSRLKQEGQCGGRILGAVSSQKKAPQPLIRPQMKLPYVVKARVERRKIVEYLLSSSRS